MSYNIKQDVATTAAHSKRILDLTKNINFWVLVSVLYGIIKMDVLSITDVLHTYTYFQYYHNPII